MSDPFDDADDCMKASERECWDLVTQEAKKRPLTDEEIDVVLWHLGFLPRQREFRA